MARTRSLSRLKRLEAHFSITHLTDWSHISPQQVLSAPNFGPATLDELRHLLSFADVTLQSDLTPEFWQEHFSMPPDLQPVVCPFTVIVDTREQHPYKFNTFFSDAKLPKPADADPFDPPTYRPLYIPTETATLRSGDYSLLGLEDKVSVERKSLEDLYGTLGQGRERFERELERLNQMEFAKVVIEASMRRVVSEPPENSALSPVSVHRSILAFQQRYVRVHWCYADTRHHAERETFRTLEMFHRIWHKQQEEQEAQHD